VVAMVDGAIRVVDGMDALCRMIRLLGHGGHGGRFVTRKRYNGDVVALQKGSGMGQTDVGRIC
jgi:hypothetical protein